ncbi:LacI family DNA-binding transcriptional regulator [Microbacterium hominis]|uniref:LacI family DNA-binding transcriptional regulator n=1 Tax=Microbacterium hominis TaxID=162426 RepID=A0A7D4QGS9_9MICO|nr:LacI family DNA-binding transcriptional regulator [Microbacterium hominis]QKJ18476.1 LacI family DNA-binding transcriptional regulator [Microbacterium hominis]
MARINEVAEAAGVSISTVSYALSGKRPVSPATRKRVEDAVQRLGYSPNAGARMLAGRRTNIFALTEPLRRDTHAPTHMAFVLATAVAARRHDYDILLLTDEQARAGMSRVAANGLVDAILVLDVAPDDERAALSRLIATPTVFIGVPDDHAGLVCVDLDFEAAAALAVDRLADAGHARIGLIGQHAVAYEKSNFPPRVKAAFERRADERGIHHDFRVSGHAQPDLAVARRAVREMLADEVTGLVLHCTEEEHAAVLRELAAQGLRVPGDISVVAVGASFDTEAHEVPVDTVPLIPAASCERAVTLALECLGAERPEPGVRLIDPVYHDHASVAPPRRL